MRKWNETDGNYWSDISKMKTNTKKKKKEKMQQTRMAYSKKMCISLTNDDALLLLRYFVAVSLLFLAACSHLVHCSLIGFEYCVQANDISLG